MATEPAIDRRDILVQTSDAELPGVLSIPVGANGLVVFAHGSGSHRLSARNMQMADSLNAVGLATLLFELLTPAEYAADQDTRVHRFDIPLLADRLTATLEWLPALSVPGALPVGLLGIGTGAAAALITAGRYPESVSAVVSRGGRPDLAGESLRHVKSPTLLIAGSEDGPVIEMNRDASNHLYCLMRLEIVPGATHLFDEPGALESASELATDWFLNYLRRNHPWYP